MEMEYVQLVTCAEAERPREQVVPTEQIMPAEQPLDFNPKPIYRSWADEK